MAKKNLDGDWLDIVAEAAETEKSIVDGVLSANHIRPSPICANPRRLHLNRIYFSGEKIGIAEEGPFEFDWNDLCPGLWGLITESNLKGKSSVLEVVRWMLRGRASGTLQEDVKGWINRAGVVFQLDGVKYEVHVESKPNLKGRLLRFEGDVAREMAAFKSPEQFESVMSDFFMRELSLDPVTVIVSGQEFESGKSATHEWPWLSGALYIGTDYSALLGEQIMSGLAIRIMQMFLGLPWVSTLCEGKAAQQRLTQEKDARTRRRKVAVAGRSERTEGFSNVLQSKKAKLETMESDDEIRAQLETALQGRRNLGQELRSSWDRRDEAQRVLTPF